MNKKKIITLITILLFFQLGCCAMELEKIDAIGPFPLEIWESIGIQMFPSLIGKSREIIESCKQIAKLATVTKELQDLFTQDWIKKRILRVCENSLSIYGAKYTLDKKAKINNYDHRWLVVGTLTNAVRDVEEFNVAIYNPVRTEEQIEYIKKCIATWNVEMEIWYYPEGSNRISLHLGGSFLNQISKLNSSALLIDLIDHGVDVGKKNRCKSTPVRCAMGYGCFESAQLLLQYEQKVREKDYRSVLSGNESYFCQTDGQFESFFSLIKDLIENHGLSVDAQIINYKEMYEVFSGFGWMPLLFAAILHNNKQLTEYLVNKGANPKAKLIIHYRSNRFNKVDIRTKKTLISFAERCRRQSLSLEK